MRLCPLRMFQRAPCNAELSLLRLSEIERCTFCLWRGCSEELRQGHGHSENLFRPCLQRRLDNKKLLLKLRQPLVHYRRRDAGFSVDPLHNLRRSGRFSAGTRHLDFKRTIMGVPERRIAAFFAVAAARWRRVKTWNPPALAAGGCSGGG